MDDPLLKQKGTCGVRRCPLRIYPKAPRLPNRYTTRDHSKDEMAAARVSVIYYSMYGHVGVLAKAVAEGLKVRCTRSACRT